MRALNKRMRAAALNWSAQTSWEMSGYIKLGAVEGGEEGKNLRLTTNHLRTMDVD